MGRPNEPDVLLQHIKRYHNATQGYNDDYKTNINQLYYLSSCYTVWIAISINTSLIIYSHNFFPCVASTFPPVKSKKSK